MMKKLACILENSLTTKFPIVLVMVVILFPLFYNPSIVLAANPTSSSNSFYVDGSTGSDLNAGTYAQPWKTIQKAVDNAIPGTTILIAPGNYNESVRITRTGKESAPIHLVNIAGARVIVNGGDKPAIVIYSEMPKYWIIEGLTLISSGTITVNFAAYGCNGNCYGIDHWTFSNNTIIGSVLVYGAYNLFEGNIIDGTTNNGNGNAIRDSFSSSHHNTFRNNNIHSFSERGIWSMNQTHDDIIEGNTINDIGSTYLANHTGQCIDLDGFGAVVWRHSVSGNILNHCDYGIALENAFDSSVENNNINNSSQQAVNIMNYGPHNGPGTVKCQAGGENNQYGDTDGNNNCEGDITNNIIQNNSITNTNIITWGGITIFYAGGIRIWNNTISNSTHGIFIIDSVLCPEISVQGNTFFNNYRADISVADLNSPTQDTNNTFVNKNQNKAYLIRAGEGFISLSKYQQITGKGEGSVYMQAAYNIFFSLLFK